LKKPNLFNFLFWGYHPRPMKIKNPPSSPFVKGGITTPPFSKGRLGGIFFLNNSKGISVIFLIIAMVLMITIGYVFSYLIPSKQKSVVFPIQSTQAFFIAQSGVEFAIRYAQENGVGTLNGTTLPLGNGQFSLTYNASGTGTLTSNGQVPAGTTRRSIQISNFTSFLAPISINYFSSASNPPDGGNNTANPTAVTHPGAMLAGDLVLMIALSRANSGTLAISNTGGQSWTSETQQNQNNCRLRLFWCRFNGTWTANPSVSFGNTNPHIVVMHVFRPSNTSSVWEVDVAQVSGNFNAPPGPNRTVTIPGITTITDGALVFAGWATPDNNTWGNLTAGWTTPGSAQYRNSSGNDQSETHAYRVMATAGGTGNVSKNETSSGGGGYEAGAYLIIAFKAILTCP
jgi:hypothetical protein